MPTIRPLLVLFFALLLSGCGKPVPADKAAYVGNWTGTGVTLSIAQDGELRYRRQSGNNTTSINAPIKEYAGANLVVGVGPLTTTFVVSAGPRQVGETWKMTVDGVELTRQF